MNHCSSSLSRRLNYISKQQIIALNLSLTSNEADALRIVLIVQTFTPDVPLNPPAFAAICVCGAVGTVSSLLGDNSGMTLRKSTQTFSALSTGDGLNMPIDCLTEL